MTEFCLQRIYDGWESVRSPDNIEFTIQFSEDKSLNIYSSIIELIELYNKVRAKEECNMMISTGNIIHIETNDEGVVFRLDEEHEKNTTFNSLENSIEQLLQDLFSELEGSISSIPNFEREAYPFIEEVYYDVTNE